MSWLARTGRHSYIDDEPLPPPVAIEPAPQVSASVVYFTPSRNDPDCTITSDYVGSFEKDAINGHGWCYKLKMRYAERGGVRRSQTDISVRLTREEAAEYHAFCCRVEERALRDESLAKSRE